MFHISGCGLLVVAYARADNVKKIVNDAVEFGIERIYVALDVSENNPEIHYQTSLIEDFVSEKKQTGVVSILIHKRGSNVGCSANILSGIDWAFKFEKYLAIVEDDCLPTSDFYTLIASSKEKLDSDSSIWIVGGTQVAPLLTRGQPLLSRYPITWGWATTRKKWVEIRSAVVDGARSFERFKVADLAVTECRYWQTGARRSYLGIIDAWDITLALAFLQNNRFCILPPESLVMNVGNDIFALHTNSYSSGIQGETGSWAHSLENLTRSLEYESWIRKTHFKIRSRHLLTNQIRKFSDSVFGFSKRSNQKTLLEKWQNATI